MLRPAHLTFVLRIADKADFREYGRHGSPNQHHEGASAPVSYGARLLGVIAKSDV